MAWDWYPQLPNAVTFLDFDPASDPFLLEGAVTLAQGADVLLGDGAAGWPGFTLYVSNPYSEPLWVDVRCAALDGPRVSLRLALTTLEFGRLGWVLDRPGNVRLEVESEQKRIPRQRSAPEPRFSGLGVAPGGFSSSLGELFREAKTPTIGPGRQLALKWMAEDPVAQLRRYYSEGQIQSMYGDRDPRPPSGWTRLWPR